MASVQVLANFSNKLQFGSWKPKCFLAPRAILVDFFQRVYKIECVGVRACVCGCVRCYILALRSSEEPLRQQLSPFKGFLPLGTDSPL